MSIAFANSGSGGINTSGTDFSTAPINITAAAVGDWVYCGIFNAANEASITFTGWTQLLSADQGTTTHYSLWRRQKQSGDTTFAASWPTSQKATWIWVSYSGLDGTTPDELAGEASAASATQTTPSLTPNSNDRWSLCFFWVRSTASAPAAFGSYTSPLGARVDALPQAASRFVRAAAADTASAVTQAAHQYSATSTNGSQGGAILLFLIPAVAGDGTVTAVMADATADGIVPTVTADSTVAAVQATATADAFVPMVTGDATVTAVQATAAADVLVPSVSGGATPDATVTVPAPAVASATALAPTVTVDATVLAVIADATAAALLPTLLASSTVIPPTADAGADAIPPDSVGAPLNKPRWVEHTGGGGAVVDSAGAGVALAERAGGGSAVVDAAATATHLVDQTASGVQVTEGSGGV